MMMVRDPELVLAVSHRQHVHIDDAKPIGAEGSCRGLLQLDRLLLVPWQSTRTGAPERSASTAAQQKKNANQKASDHEN